MAEDEPAELKSYLRSLGWGLSTMSKSDRDEIIDEAREHILGRVDQGASLDAVLLALGTPDVYARRFLDEAEIVSALASQRPMTVLGAVLRRVHRSATAGLAFVLVLILCTLAGFGIIACVMKVIDPLRVGLWVGDDGFFFGHLDHLDNRREVLGNWIYPLTVVAIAGSWFMGRFILFWALRRQNRRAGSIDT